MTQSVGIIAGAGELPVIVAQAIARQGKKRVVIALGEKTSPKLRSESDIFETIAIGQLQGCIDFLKKHHVKDVLLCGQIDHKEVFDPKSFDSLLLSLIQQDNRAEAILGRITAAIENQGLKVADIRTFLDNHLIKDSSGDSIKLAKKQQADVDFAWPIALNIADLNIGQAIMVNSGVVIAVEAIEGTTNMIMRTAELNLSGSTVIKLPLKNKDPRFDLPVIGSQTLEAMTLAGASVLVVAAGNTIIIDPEKCQQIIKKHEISIVAKSLPGGT